MYLESRSSEGVGGNAGVDNGEEDDDEKEETKNNNKTATTVARTKEKEAGKRPMT